MVVRSQHLLHKTVLCVSHQSPVAGQMGRARGRVCGGGDVEGGEVGGASSGGL